MAKRYGNAMVKVIDPKTEYVSEYSMDIRLRRNLDEKIKPALNKKDKDNMMIIDGAEGSGKSTFAFQIGKYVDPSLNLDRVVFSADEFREAVFKAKKGQCIIYDEAFTGFSSRASLSAINRMLVNLVMQMRQKNLLVIIVLPTFFMLDRYLTLFRSKTLFHVYEVKGNRGYFRVYNTRLKKMLYLLGKKTMSYSSKVRTRFRGRFYGKFALGDGSAEAKYKKNKQKSLEDSEKNPMTAGQVKYKEQRDILLWLFKNYIKLTFKQLENLLSEYDIEMSYVQISRICAKFGNLSPVKISTLLKNDTKDLNKDNPIDFLGENEEETIDSSKKETENL